MLDKSAFCGGNSTKATSGINAGGTRMQAAKEIHDSAHVFYEDTLKSARDLARPDLIKRLTFDSADCVHWLEEHFDLDLSILGRLGGHSHPRTHRGAEKFPGMTITYALMEAAEKACKEQPHRARLLNKAKATKLLVDPANPNRIIGVEYEHKGQTLQEHGSVIITTGGYGADFSKQGLLHKYRPDLAEADIATTNGEHCTGDGINMGVAAGAATIDMNVVQVHPTGLVDPRDPECKVKWLAAEALRGTGAILINGVGERFVNELGHRDYVSGEIFKNREQGKGPFRLVLNSACAKEIHWHCEHYSGRGLMKFFKSGAELAKEMGISPAKLEATFKQYSQECEAKKDAYGKIFFNNGPWRMDDTFYVSQITPVVHYTMGGLQVDDHARVINTSGTPMEGLWSGGEAAGGVHGINRLGGSSLLDCVVYGRFAGREAAAYTLENALRNGVASGDAANGSVSVNITPTGDNKVNVEVSWGKGAAASSTTTATTAAPAAAASAAEGSSTDAVDRSKVYTMEEVAKHTTDNDCWIVVNGDVLDATSFLGDHPGGKGAIMLYAGKDATAEFNMLHDAGVVEKYAPEIIIGKIAPKAKL